MLVQIRMVALGRMRCPTLLDNAWSLPRSLSLSCLSGQKKGGTGSCRLRCESGTSAFIVLCLRPLGSGAARLFLCISQDAVTGGRPVELTTDAQDGSLEGHHASGRISNNGQRSFAGAFQAPLMTRPGRSQTRALRLTPKPSRTPPLPNPRAQRAGPRSGVELAANAWSV